MPPAATFATASSDTLSKTAWNWSFVLGKSKGRKPAIKKPARHQWYYCNPRYNPNKPLPSRILPPHAPPTAASSDDWELFHAKLGSTLNPGSRAEFARFLKQRDVDWRNAFHRELADYVKASKKEEAAKAEAARQKAWQDWRVKVFADAAGSKS